ncbi:MAG: hypothetical protein ACTHMV_06755 [Chitinophagaceae bacterium]
MKKIFSLCAFSLFASIAFGQKEVFDVISFTPPKGWKKEVKQNVLIYSSIDQKRKNWCQLIIYKSTSGKGSLNADFESEWQELVVKNYNPADMPQLNETAEENGWKIKAGTAKFTFNGQDAMVMLTTASGYERCASIVVTTNSNGYLNIAQNFFGSVHLKQYNTPPDYNNKQATTETKPSPAKPDGFQFVTTNFDDGWTSVVKDDWVEVTKGDIKVLLHYPKEGTVFPADPEPLINAAWNILVAPRYSNLKNYRTAYITTYNRPYLGMGYATENSTGKEVFVLLFRQGGEWIEFITPDKKTFIQQYKFDPDIVQWDTESDLMKPLVNMSGYNKFAVAASDFKGKWTSDFTGIQQLYHVYTGNYAGMNVHQSSIIFDFKANYTYYWKLLAVNGMVGNMKIAQVESTGTFSIPNSWQLQCSKIEKGPKLYHAFWSCIKGARILNLMDANDPGSGIYEKFGLAK